jgi:hypothetical protein
VHREHRRRPTPRTLDVASGRDLIRCGRRGRGHRPRLSSADENYLFGSSTNLQAGAAAAIPTLAANGNVTATEQLPEATQPTNKCARWLACASVRECHPANPQ